MGRGCAALLLSLSLYPVPAAAQRVLVEDRLESVPNSVGAAGRITRFPGGLRIEARSQMELRFSATITGAYYRLSLVTAYQSGGAQGGYGIAFAQRGSEIGSNRYQFRIGPLGYYFRHSTGRWQETDARHRGPNAVDTLVVEVRGREITLLLNGVRLEQLTAPEYLDGDCGIVVGGDATVGMSRFRIEVLEPPEPAPGSLDMDFLSSRSADFGFNASGRRDGQAFLVTANQYAMVSESAPGWLPPRVRIETSWTRVSGPGTQPMSLTFGQPVWNRSYRKTFSVYGDGTWEVLQDESQVIGRTPHRDVHTALGERNDLAVEVRGVRAWFYINGTLVGSHTFREYVGGYMGTALGAGLTARLEVLRVSTLPPGDQPSPSLPPPLTAAVAAAPEPAAVTPTAARVAAPRPGSTAADPAGTAFAPITDLLARSEGIDEATAVSERVGNSMVVRVNPDAPGAAVVPLADVGEIPVDVRYEVTVTPVGRAGETPLTMGLLIGGNRRVRPRDYTIVMWDTEGQHSVLSHHMLTGPRREGPRGVTGLRTALGASNRLRVDVRTDSVTVWFNGRMLWTVAVPASRTAGYPSLIATAGEARFDSLTITPLPPPGTPEAPSRRAPARRRPATPASRPSAP